METDRGFAGDPPASLVDNTGMEIAEEQRDETGSNASMHARTQDDADFLDDLISMRPEPPPVATDVPEYYANDFAQVPDRLRNAQPMQSFDVPMEICDDFHNVIFPEIRHIVTMDGVSKSFVTIRPDDASHYVQPFEGAPFTFVDR